MNNKVENLFEKWVGKYGKDANYNPETVKSIIINCVSLSETWFDRYEEKEKVSYELTLFNKDGIVFETLHGITRENLPETMLKIITDMYKNVTKINLNAFLFKNGEKVSKTIGELEIS